MPHAREFHRILHLTAYLPICDPRNKRGYRNPSAHTLLKIAIQSPCRSFHVDGFALWISLFLFYGMWYGKHIGKYQVTICIWAISS